VLHGDDSGEYADPDVKVRLAYGREGLDVELPDERTTVVEPAYHAGAADERAVLREALRTPVAGPPLKHLARRGMKVAISMCDGTRAQPRDTMIPAVLEELGLPDEDIVILVATGTHRANTPEEIEAMLGRELAQRVAVVNHDARDPSTLTSLGVHGNGVPVHVNTRWVEADLRITTGFVEPHFFAGFSGGPKLVTPGLAGLETVLVLHDATRIGDPKATWGITHGNPVHDDIRAAASAAPPHFAFDVILNREQRIIEAFAGVKGMSAAAKVVKPGGLIVCAAECRDGFPGHGSYRELLGQEPRAFLQAIKQSDHVTPDQWQVQIQYNVQDHARVVVHTSHLSDEELRAVHLEQTSDITRTVAAEGPNASVCVLPEGPQTIAYVRQ
jgi:nickel-dependent lactate racemase